MEVNGFRPRHVCRTKTCMSVVAGSRSRPLTGGGYPRNTEYIDGAGRRGQFPLQVAIIYFPLQHAPFALARSHLLMYQMHNKFFVWGNTDRMAFINAILRSVTMTAGPTLLASRRLRRWVIAHW